MNRRTFLKHAAITASGLLVPAYLGRSHVAISNVQFWDRAVRPTPGRRATHAGIGAIEVVPQRGYVQNPDTLIEVQFRKVERL